MGIKYAVNESFFEQWSPEMAYVVGYWYADGSMEDAHYIRAKYIRVTSTDKQTLVNIKRLLAAEHPVTLLKKYHGNVRDRYLLRIGSHRLYQSLEVIGLRPNKSLTMSFPNVPRAYLNDFVRGYFDGDGWVGIEKSMNRSGEPSVKRISVAFTSGSRSFLETMSSELHRAFGTSLKRVNHSHRSFQLRYSTKDSIELFKSMYRTPGLFHLPRKFSIFKHYFRLRPERVDRMVHTILRRPSGEVG